MGDAHLVEGAGVEYIEATAPVHQHLGEACGAHNQANHEWVVPRMRDTIGVVFLAEGDGHLGPSEPRQSSVDVNGIHLLLSDAVLPTKFIGLESPEDHEAALGLRELSVFLLGIACQVAGL